MITLLGPTASGKTALAVRLAHRLGSEILSADSRQVYRGMDVGTGKDLSEYTYEGKTIPYHLIDIVLRDEVQPLRMAARLPRGVCCHPRARHPAPHPLWRYRALCRSRPPRLSSTRCRRPIQRYERAYKGFRSPLSVSVLPPTVPCTMIRTSTRPSALSVLSRSQTISSGSASQELTTPSTSP